MKGDNISEEWGLKIISLLLYFSVDFYCFVTKTNMYPHLMFG